MQAEENGSGRLSRKAGWRLILAALWIAAALIAASFLEREGLEFTWVLLIALAGLLGGWLLNAHAFVRGLPLTIAGIMALTLLLAAIIGTTDPGVAGGTVFMALLVSAVARSRGVGIAAAAILAGAVLLAAAL